jgi:hypothetical protein
MNSPAQDLVRRVADLRCALAERMLAHIVAGDDWAAILRHISDDQRVFYGDRGSQLALINRGSRETPAVRDTAGA